MLVYLVGNVSGYQIAESILSSFSVYDQYSCRTEETRKTAEEERKNDDVSQELELHKHKDWLQ